MPDEDKGEPRVASPPEVVNLDAPALDPSRPETWPALLNVAQTAAALGMHPDTVARLLREGKLPGRRLGGQWFVRRSDLLGPPTE